MLVSRGFVVALTAFSFTLFTSISSNAQTDFNLESGNKFTAELSSEFGQISNFLYNKDNEQSTGYIKIAPTAFVQAQHARHLVQLSANASRMTFNDFTQDKHTNLLANPKYFYKLDYNKTLFADVKLAEEYEFRGTGLSLGEANSITRGDKQRMLTTNIGYLYGQIDSVAKVKFSLGQEDFRYKTRRDKSRKLDRINIAAKASFDYLLSGKTYFAVDLAYIQTDFEHNPMQNKDVYEVLAGMKWQSTSITQLQALVGHQEINFTDKLLANDSGIKWRIDLNWQPTPFTKMNINTQRNYEAANRIADSYRVVDNTHLLLSNQLSHSFRSSVALGYKQEKIIFTGKVTTEDYLYSEIKLNYQRNNWLTLFATATFSELESSEDLLDHQRNSISLGFSVTI